MSTRFYPCECGKGTYTEVSEMDDWNRIRSTQTINCSYCKLKEKEIDEKIKRDRERLNKLEKEIKVYFVENYMEQWIAYFSTAKSKKEVWEYSRNIGINTESLSIFYSKKYPSMEEYIKGLATYRNMKDIMSKLNILDSNLTSKVEEAMKLSKQEYARAIAT